MAKLPPSDLLTLRRYLHSPPNDTLQRNYFNRMILASLTSSSQAAEMLQTQHIIWESDNTKTRMKGMLLTVNGSSFRVCIKYFVWVYNVSLKYFYRCLKAGQGQRTLRRGSGDSEKCRVIRKWLTDFSQWHEYMPNESRIQLPYSWKHQVYEYYQEDSLNATLSSATPELHLKLIAAPSYFYHVWAKYEPQIILRRHLRFSICDECAKLRRHRDKHLTETQLILNQKLFRDHMQLIQEERGAYHNKRDSARIHRSKYLSIIMDGSTQYGYNMPHFKYTTKINSTVEKMKLHVTGVLVHGWRAFMYTSNDRWIGGSSLSVEILQRTLAHLEQDRALPPIFYLQLDNTSKDNKNNYVFVYLAWLIFRGIFQRIEVSFLPVGHTHEDIDQMFSRTSVQLKNIDIPTRREFERELTNSYDLFGGVIVEHVDAVIDWKDWVEQNQLYHSIPQFHGIQHFKFEKDSQGIVRIMVKSRFNAKDWSGFESRDVNGHALLPEFMPSKLPSRTSGSSHHGISNNGGISSNCQRSFSIPMSTPRPPSTGHEEYEKALRKGLDTLSRSSHITSFQRQLLEEDIDVYANRQVQPLSLVWQDDGSFKREKMFLEKQVSGEVSMDESVFNYANFDLLYSDEPRAPELDEAVRQAREIAEIARNEVDEPNMVNPRDMSDEKYEIYITMDNLEKLPCQHRVTRAKVNDFVILAGDPIFVGQIGKLNIFDEDLEQEGNTHWMEVIWFQRDAENGCPWKSKYRMEPNEDCLKAYQIRNSKKHSRQATSKIPFILPQQHQFRQRYSLYEAYCVFQLDENRTIPIEIVEWMKTYTQIEDEYKGRQEEERTAASQKQSKQNKSKQNVTSTDHEGAESETEEDAQSNKRHKSRH
jgi:hypothetical protein